MIEDEAIKVEWSEIVEYYAKEFKFCLADSEAC